METFGIMIMVCIYRVLKEQTLELTFHYQSKPSMQEIEKKPSKEHVHLITKNLN